MTLIDCTFADHLSNVMIHERICIPVSLCQEDQEIRHPSKIILSNSHGESHLTWMSLKMRPNVNCTYNTTTQSYQFCFYDVTENFLFVEYCDVARVHGCEIDATFCCKNWVEFISRTRVNVTGDSCKLRSSWVHHTVIDENRLHSELNLSMTLHKCQKSNDALLLNK